MDGSAKLAVTPISAAYAKAPRLRSSPPARRNHPQKRHPRRQPRRQPQVGPWAAPSLRNLAYSGRTMRDHRMGGQEPRQLNRVRQAVAVDQRQQLRVASRRRQRSRPRPYHRRYRAPLQHLHRLRSRPHRQTLSLAACAPSRNDETFLLA